MRGNYPIGLCLAFAGAGTNPYSDTPGPCLRHTSTPTLTPTNTPTPTHTPTPAPTPLGPDWTLADWYLRMNLKVRHSMRPSGRPVGHMVAPPPTPVSGIQRPTSSWVMASSDSEPTITLNFNTDASYPIPVGCYRLAQGRMVRRPVLRLNTATLKPGCVCLPVEAYGRRSGCSRPRNVRLRSTSWKC